MTSKRILLVNPTITAHRHARAPLAVMSLSAALDGKYASTIIDGNIDREFVSTTVRNISDGSVGAVGISVMGGPQLRSAIAVSKAIRKLGGRLKAERAILEAHSYRPLRLQFRGTFRTVEQVFRESGAARSIQLVIKIGVQIARFRAIHVNSPHSNGGPTDHGAFLVRAPSAT